MISIIVAMDKNNAIGYRGELLAYLPGDLPRFKRITTGHAVIMGRKTFETFPNGPLPGRRNIVISRNPELKIEGAEVVHSLEEAIALVDKSDESFIIGGGEIYLQAFNMADRLYITHINNSFEADTWFPEIDDSWVVESEENGRENPLEFKYTNYIRKN